MSPANPEVINLTGSQPLRREGYGAGMRARSAESQAAPAYSNAALSYNNVSEVSETSLSQPLKPAARPTETKLTEARQATAPLAPVENPLPQAEAALPRRSLNALVQGMAPGRKPAQTADTTRNNTIAEPYRAPAPVENLATAFKVDVPVEQQSTLLKYTSPGLVSPERVAQLTTSNPAPSNLYEAQKEEYQPREALELIKASQSFVGDPFEAPNCIQTMRIDTLSGTRTTTTMLPDNSSTRIECMRGDKSSSVTVTENLRSASSIKARPLSVRELSAEGTLVSETRYYYHNFNQPTTPTAKSVISGNEMIEYRLDESGNIVDKLVLPLSQIKTA